MQFREILKTWSLLAMFVVQEPKLLRMPAASWQINCLWLRIILLSLLSLTASTTRRALTLNWHCFKNAVTLFLGAGLSYVARSVPLFKSRVCQKDLCFLKCQSLFVRWNFMQFLLFFLPMIWPRNIFMRWKLPGLTRHVTCQKRLGVGQSPLQGSHQGKYLSSSCSLKAIKVWG